MRKIRYALFVFSLAFLPMQGIAQQDVRAAQDEIFRLERTFNQAIKVQDSIQVIQFLSKSFVFTLAIQGLALQTIAKSFWLNNLKSYLTESFNIDDIHVRVYDNTAVAVMLITQNATLRGNERSGQYLVTDVWTKEGSAWKISSRLSSRPEQRPAGRVK